ncbi:PadR family transcriptional regulator [Mollicutes bacterium LVI A0039]|nr:PadR family transcriptional regulator [Mollicutes bacterium LVI A0039]
MDVQLKRGLLDICVLKILTRGDSYGYQIVKDVSDIIPISESTLYPILKRLESSECLEVYTVEHNGRLRKYFKITAKGYNKISEFIEDFQQVIDIMEIIKEEEDER